MQAHDSKDPRSRPIVPNGDTTATMYLAGGKTALIDMRDAHLIQGRAWCVAGRGYVIASDTTKLHRLIMGAGPGEEVDHINGNPLDNRRSNLRMATSAQNKWNTRRFSNNTSGYRGVSFRKDRGKFRAYINLDNKQRSLGMFHTAEEAARAYDAAAKELFGEFARLNFPD